jgi:hypothetical protein
MPDVVVFECKIDETNQGVDPEPNILSSAVDLKESMEPSAELAAVGIRTLWMDTIYVGKYFYDCPGFPKRISGSAAQRIRDLGVLIKYSDEHYRTGRRKKVPIKVDEFVKLWLDTIVGLCTAHDKDAVDRYEVQVEECLKPMLRAPVKQLREFGPKLLAALKEDQRVPYLVWVAYEVWIAQMKDAPDEDIKELKADLAKQVVDLVIEDARRDLPHAMVLALQWRSPEKLQKTKEVVERERAAGRPARVRGRESCLFLEVGGTEEAPEVCVQI